MVCHFGVDMIGRDRFLTGPALFYGFNEFGGDVDAEAVLPSILEPLFEFLAGIYVEDIDVKFTLF